MKSIGRKWGMGGAAKAKAARGMGGAVKAESSAWHGREATSSAADVPGSTVFKKQLS